MRILQRSLLLLIPLLALASETRAQAEGITTLDEGRFLISMQGRQVGSEEFYIRRRETGDADTIIAAATISWNGPAESLNLHPILQATGAEMALSKYQIEVSGDRQEEVVIALGGNRYQSSVRSERGVQEREFRASPRTLLLDTGVAHQYYFIAQRFPSGGGSVPILVPQAGRQYDLNVTEVGSETIVIGGVSLRSRRLRLEGNQETREIWLDSQGRVLKVEHPGGGYSALRETAP
jgi:hypothetical protein